MAALIGRMWRSAFTHVLRDVSNVSPRIQPSGHPCTRWIFGKNANSLQTGRSLSSSPHSLSANKPTTDIDTTTESSDEVLSLKSTTSKKRKKRKKEKHQGKFKIDEQLDDEGTSEQDVDRERLKKEESVLLSEEVEPRSPRVWVMDKHGEFCLKDVKSPNKSAPGGDTRMEMMEDPPDDGQAWSIPDIYESEEFRRCVQAAERSILVHCPQRTISECITVCESMAPVSRVLKIHNKAILVTYESDISDILAGGFRKCNSDAVSIKQTEKRVFLMWINRKKFNSTQQPVCKNISVLKQRNYQRLLMNETIEGQMKILGNRTKNQSERQQVLFFLRQCIQDVVDLTRPNYLVVPFGSVLNGFICDTSDLDTALVYTGSRQKQANETALLSEIAKKLKMLDSYNSILSIFHARVPIIKYHNRLLEVGGDISYQSINSSGKTATICLNALSRCSPSVVPFIMTVKLWTKLYVDWFPSKFVFTALALFYLQRCQIIPPIQNIKVINKSPVDGEEWKCVETVETKSLDRLLCGFFQFYKDFDFNVYDICLKSGKIIPKLDHQYTIIMNPFCGNKNSEEYMAARIRDWNVARIQAAMAESVRILSESPSTLLQPTEQYWNTPTNESFKFNKRKR